MTALALLAPLGLTAGGCADNDSMLFVAQVIKLDGDCVANPDPSGTFLAGGVLDLAFRSNYQAALLVGNQLTRQGSREKIRTETSRITLRGAEIELLAPDESAITTFTVPGTGTVGPSSGTDPGYGAMFAQLIPDNTNVGGYPYVVANIRVFGDTLGGEEITSSELSFPISVCTGCLISFPNEAIDPATGMCTGATEGDAVAPCNFGQDDLIPCWMCAANNTACRSPGG